MKTIWDLGLRIGDCSRALRVSIGNPKSPIRILVCLALLLALLPACRIGSGFDTAEKQRNLTWDEPVQSAGPAEPATVEQLQSPPIVYLLVAG